MRLVRLFSQMTKFGSAALLLGGISVGCQEKKQPPVTQTAKSQSAPPVSDDRTATPKSAQEPAPTPPAAAPSEPAKPVEPTTPPPARAAEPAHVAHAAPSQPPPASSPPAPPPAAEAQPVEPPPPAPQAEEPSEDEPPLLGSGRSEEESRQKVNDLMYGLIRFNMQLAIEKRKDLLAAGLADSDETVRQLEAMIFKARSLLTEQNEILEDVDPPIRNPAPAG